MNDPALATRYADALRTLPPRAAQVLSQSLLRRRTLEEAAAFYGLGVDAFAALLARSLAPLLFELEGLRIEEEPLARQLLSKAERAASVRSVIEHLEALGPRLLAEQQALTQPESWTSTLVRVGVIAALIAIALGLSRVLG